MPRLDLAHSLALGSSTPATLSYPAGIAFAMFVDLDHGLQPLPGIAVPVLLAPTLAFLFAVTATGDSTTVPIVVPNQPQLLDLVLFFQAAAIGSSGGVQLSNAVAALVVR